MDIEDISKKRGVILSYEEKKKYILNNQDEVQLINFIYELASCDYKNRQEYDKKYNFLKRKYKLSPSKVQLNFIFNELKNEGKFNKLVHNTEYIILIWILICFTFMLKCMNNSSNFLSYFIIFQFSILYYLYKNNIRIVSNTQSFEFYAKRKIGKSHSGILNITVLTSPFPEYTKNGKKVKQSFSCGKNCAYCPDEPAHKDNNMQAQPRSYIYSEPAVLRANACGFDAERQFNDRANTLQMCGHIVDKIELFILGGTWSHYPKEYREEFCRDLYYAANIFNSVKNRTKLSLENEILINEKAKCRIIGLTIETRPDCITKKEIIHLRKLGVTRIQLGVQHIDNNVLEFINRESTVEDAENALRLWKNNAGKVDIHLMPDLPGSSLEQDKEMFDELLDYDITNMEAAETKKIDEQYYNLIGFIIAILTTIIVFKFTLNKYISIFTYLFCYICINYIIDIKLDNTSDLYMKYNLKNKNIQADQWKIYPTMTTRWTKIKEWYDNGDYKPYAEEDNGDKLINLLIHVKLKALKWIRFNRVIRDIPSTEIYGGHKKGNLRQDIHELFIKKGYVCNCIRCREVKCNKVDLSKAILCVREYEANDGTEYFISYESPDEKYLYGFLRLRINTKNLKDICFPELSNSALIRELHVYGQMVKHNISENNGKPQHYGFGKRLMKHAEKITKENKINKLAVISGIGVREYYKKLGYIKENTYMIKELL